MYRRSLSPVCQLSVTQYFIEFAQSFVVLQDPLEVYDDSGTETPVH